MDIPATAIPASHLHWPLFRPGYIQDFNAKEPSASANPIRDPNASVCLPNADGLWEVFDPSNKPPRPRHTTFLTLELPVPIMIRQPRVTDRIPGSARPKMHEPVLSDSGRSL